MNSNILKIFKLSDWVLKEDKILQEMNKVFTHDVKEDLYDVRREKIDFLFEKNLIDTSTKQKLFSTYYLNGDEHLINNFTLLLTESDKEKFLAISPYRKRAFSELLLTLNDDHHTIKIAPTKNFTQDSDDYRSLPRVFANLNKSLLEDLDFQDLLVKIAKYIKDKAKRGRTFKFEFHVMRLIVKSSDKTNTPEGKHQDGADYIIMFIANRVNVRGGISRVFSKQEDGEYTLEKEILLNEKEGLFMSDASSNLYHEVTPVSTIDQTSIGYRDLFGFDISIID